MVGAAPEAFCCCLARSGSVSRWAAQRGIVTVR